MNTVTINVMLTSGAAVLAVLSGPVRANPTRDPSECTVTILRAPDDVRAEIDKWVGGEHQCKTSLELRVVPTQGGYYLFARDDFGREHERVVPDAQTAGVLVASWVADDSFILAVPLEAPAPAVALAPIATHAPGESPAIAAASYAPPHRASGRWLAIAGVVENYSSVGSREIGGARIDVDLAARGRWSLGAAFSVRAVSRPDHVIDQAWDAIGMATLARNYTSDAWRIRLHAGLGMFVSRGKGYEFRAGMDTWPTGTAASPAIELGGLLAHTLPFHWEIAAGVVATMTDRVYRLETGDEGTTEVGSVLYGGFRRPL